MVQKDCRGDIESYFYFISDHRFSLAAGIHHLLLSMIVLCIHVTIQSERTGQAITQSCF